MITLLAVSDGYKHFGDAIGEYEKRIQKFANIKRLKPISHTNPEYIKVKETLLVLEILQKMKWKIVLLDERGSSMKTEAFMELLEKSKDQSENITFVIGGSYGVDLELFSQVPHISLKVSDFVVPHSLALLVLVEQIYRAHEIIKGSGYHHK